MSLRTSSWAIRARAIGRRLGLNRLAARMVLRGSYEERFGRALEKAIRPGDCVWDVGANVGLYSRLFASWTTDRGTVYAFEPSPANAARLRAVTAGVANVRVLECALGAERGHGLFAQGEDATGATSKLVGSSFAPAGAAIEVPIRTGFELVQSGEASSPNVIKIDTEGYELDVVRGLGPLVGSRGLRAILIEVHFGLLAARGMPDAPATIEALLTRAGFTVRWIDASHLEAARA
jgi:FkbM family methyltransferase